MENFGKAMTPVSEMSEVEKEIFRIFGEEYLDWCCGGGELLPCEPTPEGIAGHLRLDVPTVKGIIMGMVEKGWVRVLYFPTDTARSAGRKLT